MHSTEKNIEALNTFIQKQKKQYLQTIALLKINKRQTFAQEIFVPPASTKSHLSRRTFHDCTQYVSYFYNYSKPL